MKYGYKDADLHMLIERYEIIDDKIKIYYLDGGVNEIPFKKDYEIEIINQMLEQAEDRMKCCNLDKLKRQREIKKILAYFSGITLGAGSIAAIMNLSDGDCSVTMLAGMPTITIISMLTLAHISRVNSKVNELEKYEIYLSLRKELENISDLDIYSGIEMKTNSININTLDNYSLNDLYRIKENLGTNKKYTKSNTYSKVV